MELYLEIYEDEINPTTILEMFENKENLWTGTLIQPQMYQKALDEFVRYGELVRFPANKIYQWARNVVRNIVVLEVCTEFYGHSETSPIEDFLYFYFYDDENGDVDYDKWNEYKEQIGEDDDFGAMYDFLEKRGFYEWAVLPNGDSALSDFVWTLGGTRQGGYNTILKDIDMDKTPEELLVLINKALDMYHVRGDLSCMLIQGGSESLSKISGSAYVTEKINKRHRRLVNERRLSQILRESISNVLKQQIV